MSCMLKPAVPSAVANKRRRVRPAVAKAVHASRNSARGALEGLRAELRGSCFQSANAIEHHGDDGAALHDLNQPHLAEMGEQHSRRPTR